ncbi:MAG: hypothetical protein AAFP70_01620 [Calditrichota bacterium]
MRTLLLIAFGALLSSCAALINDPTQHIELHTVPDSKVIVENDTLITSTGRIVFEVERGKQPLQLTVQNDSASKTVRIPSRSSGAYWLNAYPAPILGLGLLLERDSPKRYAYPPKVQVDFLTDNFKEYKKPFSQSLANSIYLHLSIPYVNSFLLQPDDEVDTKINTGFWGISGGLDFYYTPKRFIQLSLNTASDLFLPVPASPGLDSEYEIMGSVFLNASHNHQLNKFILGYGVSLSRNFWSFNNSAYSEDSPTPSRESVRRDNNALGLVFPAYFRVSDRFYIGTIYRPTFLRLSSQNRIDYEHLISLDLAWKIGLR